MAEFSEKMKVRLPDGTIESIRIYSTPADIPSWQKPMKVRITDGLVGWVPTSPLGSPDASALRVRHPEDPTVYVVNTIGRAVADKHFIGTAGDFTFTVPAGARKMRITLVGGGSTGIYDGSSAGYTSNSGKATSFGGVVANGAASAPANYTHYLSDKIPPQNGYFQQYGSPATKTISRYSYETSAGQDNGTKTVSRNDTFNPGTGYGAGSAGFSLYERTHYRGGLRGGMVSLAIDSIPGTVVKGTVRAGGQGFARDTSRDQSVMGNAAQGCVFIEWGGDIE